MTWSPSGRICGHQCPSSPLAVSGVGEHALVAAALAHHPETGVVGLGVDELAVPAPAPAGPVGRREVDRGPALHRDLPELPLLGVGDPASVRRDERPAVAGPLVALAGARDDLHPHAGRAGGGGLPPAGSTIAVTKSCRPSRAEAHDRREAGLRPRSRTRRRTGPGPATRALARAALRRPTQPSAEQERSGEQPTESQAPAGAAGVRPARDGRSRRSAPRRTRRPSASDRREASRARARRRRRRGAGPILRCSVERARLLRHDLG